ncbi:MAG: malectin domain-containing carbohydrate-binding protein, partial [Pseudomonadota bacterium]
IFDGLLEGVVPVAYDNIDPSADFGGGNVGVLTAEAVVEDGVLNIGFAQDAVDGKENPIINALEVIEKGFTPDLEGPNAAIAIVNPATDADPLVINVTLTDETGIDETSLGAADIGVSVGGVVVDAADIAFTGFTNGVASYTVAAPTGGWTDASVIDVTVNAGEISDTADAVNTNSETTTQATLEIGGSTGEDTVLLRINAFGPTVAATDGGPDWTSDLKDDLGTVENENSPYLNLTSTDPAQDRGDAFGFNGTPPAGVPDAVMDTARSSNNPFSYDIPVADLDGDGNYTVTLHFAELFTGNQTAGERSFDVAIEGQSIGDLQDIDPAALGGGAGASSISYNVAVT